AVHANLAPNSSQQLPVEFRFPIERSKKRVLHVRVAQKNLQSFLVCLRRYRRQVDDAIQFLGESGNKDFVGLRQFPVSDNEWKDLRNHTFDGALAMLFRQGLRTVSQNFRKIL